jgi:hypothetical protein
MVTYFLVLASLLNMDSMAPKMISPHTSYDGCAKASQKANQELARQELEETETLALRYVCLKLMSDS